jgi:hypothetical protein
VSATCLLAMETKHIAPFSAVPEGGRSRYKLSGAGGPEGVLRTDYVVYVFIFLGSIIICQFYKSTLSDQAQVTLQLTAGLSDLVLRFLADRSLLGGPHPLSAAVLLSDRPY